MGSAANLARSLVVVIALLFVFVALVPRSDQPIPTSIDVTSQAQALIRQTGLPFEIAAGLPNGWWVENVRYTKTADGAMTWQVTYRTPGGDPVAVKEAVDPSQAWLQLATAGGVQQAVVTLSGRSWQQYQASAENQYALVNRPGPGQRLTTAVVGQSSLADVRTLAAALATPSVSPSTGPNGAG